MKSFIKTTAMVAVGIAAIIGVLMSDDIYALVGVPTAATFLVCLINEL